MRAATRGHFGWTPRCALSLVHHYTPFYSFFTECSNGNSRLSPSDNQAVQLVKPPTSRCQASQDGALWCVWDTAEILHLPESLACNESQLVLARPDAVPEPSNFKLNAMRIPLNHPTFPAHEDCLRVYFLQDQWEGKVCIELSAIDYKNTTALHEFKCQLPAWTTVSTMTTLQASFEF